MDLLRRTCCRAFGLSALRLAALTLAVLALGSPAIMSAEPDLILPRRQIDQVLAAKQERERQLNALLGDYRERLLAELSFVERACGLSAVQAAALKQHGAQIFERAHRQFSEAIDGRRADRRVVVVNNRRVMVRGDRLVAVEGVAPPEESTALQLAMHEDVDDAVRTVLPDHIAARLKEERERIVEKTQQAKVSAVVAAVDDVLLLSDEQRTKLRDLLGSLWNEKWTTVATAFDRAPLTPDLAQSPMLLAKTCGLGGIFDLPDDRLEPLLRPAQWAMWKELRKPFSPQQVALQAQLQGQAAGGGQRVFGGVAVRGNVRVAAGGMVIQGADAARLRAFKLREVQQRAVQPEANQEGEPAAAPSPEEDARLELFIDGLRQVCDLPAETADKLRWAGKLDLQRHAERRLAQERELQEKLGGQAQAIGVVVWAMPPEPAYDPTADEASLFRKAAGSRLSADERRRWTDGERRRREFQRDARLELLVSGFSQRSPLTAAQWEALARLLRDRQRDLPDDATTESIAAACVTAIADVPEEQLKTIFDEVQWPAISRRLQELRQAAAQFKQ